MSSQPARKACTTETLTRVLDRVKKRVGTTRSASFNAGIVHIAATGHSIKGWAGSTCDPHERRDHPVPDELVCFLRGVRAAQMHLLTTLRRDMHALFGTDGVQLLDATLQDHPLVEAPAEGAAPRPQASRVYAILAEHMATHLQHALTDTIHHHMAVPLFGAIFAAMDRALQDEGASHRHIAEDNFASFVFTHSAGLQVDDVLARLHPGHTEDAPPPVHTVALPDGQDRLCELAEQAAELVTRTARGGFTPEGVRAFLAHVAAEDSPRRDPSVLQLVEQINRLDRQIKDTTAYSAEEQAALREERAATLRLLTAFCSGALHALHVVQLGSCKPALAQALQAGRAFDDMLQQGSSAPCSLTPALRRLVCHRLEESMRSTLLRLVADLRLEGAIKSFGESNFALVCDDTAATLQLEVLLKRHRILAGCVRSLVRMNPALTAPLIACVRVAQPLAFAIARANHTDPKEAARIAEDVHLARLMGMLIHMDSGFKGLLVNVPAFFDLLRAQAHNRELLHWLKAISSGPQEARAQLLAEPRALLALWRLHDPGADNGLTAYLLRKPLDLTHFIKLVSEGATRDNKPLQDFLHELQQRTDAPVTSRHLEA